MSVAVKYSGLTPVNDATPPLPQAFRDGASSQGRLGAWQKCPCILAAETRPSYHIRHVGAADATWLDWDHQSRWMRRNQKTGSEASHTSHRCGRSPRPGRAKIVCGRCSKKKAWRYAAPRKRRPEKAAGPENSPTQDGSIGGHLLSLPGEAAVLHRERRPRRGWGGEEDRRETSGNSSDDSSDVRELLAELLLEMCDWCRRQGPGQNNAVWQPRRRLRAGRRDTPLLGNH